MADNEGTLWAYCSEQLYSPNQKLNEYAPAFLNQPGAGQVFHIGGNTYNIMTEQSSTIMS